MESLQQELTCHVTYHSHFASKERVEMATAHWLPSGASAEHSDSSTSTQSIIASSAAQTDSPCCDSGIGRDHLSFLAGSIAVAGRLRCYPGGPIPDGVRLCREAALSCCLVHSEINSF